jgi:benzoate-CoA ligase
VERVLTSHPAVLECAVVGDLEKNGLVRPRAFIRLQPGISPSHDLTRQLLQHCSKQLAAHKCPRWIDFVEELPKTATGKSQQFKSRTTLSE